MNKIKAVGVKLTDIGILIEFPILYECGRMNGFLAYNLLLLSAKHDSPV